MWVIKEMYDNGSVQKRHYYEKESTFKRYLEYHLEYNRRWGRKLLVIYPDGTTKEFK